MQRRYDLRRSDNYMYTGKLSYVCSGSGTIFVYTGFPVTRATVGWTVYPFAQDEEMTSSSESSSSSTEWRSSSSSSSISSDSSFSDSLSSSSSSSVEYYCTNPVVVDGSTPHLTSWTFTDMSNRNSDNGMLYIRITYIGTMGITVYKDAARTQYVAEKHGILAVPQTITLNSNGLNGTVIFDGTFPPVGNTYATLDCYESSSLSQSDSSLSTEVMSSSSSSSYSGSSLSSSSSQTEIISGLPRLYVSSYADTGFTVTYENVPPQVGYIEFSFNAV